ncbi:hypothetical protein ACFXPZ_44130 [Streptomyces sp. NPDC059101]|uniref:hypothetical protein n=1 Tax=unclassified Streptomyces TaxID=2593676 RepID=UPI001C610A8E|nr:hypothetical protein [Streptomyces sp. CB02959]
MTPRSLPALALRLALAATLAASGYIHAQLFGFTERGLQPAPQALLSLIAETLTLLTVVAWQAFEVRRHRRTRPHHDATSRVRADLRTTTPDR